MGGKSFGLSDYNFMHIISLLSILIYYTLPNRLIRFIALLFFKQDPTFCKPSGAQATRTTYTGLPRGNCLSPLLFNIYAIEADFL